MECMVLLIYTKMPFMALFAAIDLQRSYFCNKSCRQRAVEADGGSFGSAPILFPRHHACDHQLYVKGCFSCLACLNFTIILIASCFPYNSLQLSFLRILIFCWHQDVAPGPDWQQEKKERREGFQIQELWRAWLSG